MEDGMHKLLVSCGFAFCIGLSAFGQTGPVMLEGIPVFAGSVRNGRIEEEYLAGYDSGTVIQAYLVDQTPEEVVSFYIKKMGSLPMESMEGPPAVKTGKASNTFHTINYLDVDSLEDGYADNGRTYEAKWIKDQLKANRKKSGEGYIDNAQIFWVYRKTAAEEIQFEIRISDRTFTAYMGGDGTGAQTGKKLYRAQTEICMVQQSSAISR